MHPGIKYKVALGGALVLALAAGGGGLQASEASYFSDWPAGTAPAEVGVRVARNVAARPFDFETNPRRKTLIYPEACAWYGALTTTRLAPEPELNRSLIARFDRFLGPDAARIDDRAHVDYRVIGIVPLEIYLQTKDEKYRAIGLKLADAQWSSPGADGITSEARYWIDDMYMITAIQVQAYRATGDTKYLDRAARTMVSYLDRLQRPNGLFYHAPDSPFFWGRGNGWVAAGMAELLRELPEDHPQRGAVLSGYRRMMAELLKQQTPEGVWRQLIDRPESWPETSGSGMFAFSMVTGVKSGWLDAEKYGPAARRAWLGLVGFLDENAELREVCVGTNKAFNEVGPDLDAQYRYYLDRKRRTGDLHGQAPLLWTASALMREAEEG